MELKERGLMKYCDRTVGGRGDVRLEYVSFNILLTGTGERCGCFTRFVIADWGRVVCSVGVKTP